MSLGESTCKIDWISGLDEGVLTEIFLWIGDGSYRMIAGTNRRFRDVYTRRVGTTTSVEQLVQTVAGAKLFCKEAKSESRFDVRTDIGGGIFVPLVSDSLATVADIAALHANMDMLKWARAQGSNFDNAFQLAAASGHLHVLEWLVDSGCVVHVYKRFFMFDRAAYRGQLEVFQWAKDKGYKWNDNSNTCTLAAASGQLKVLQWLVEHDCPWDLLTCACAAKNGHLDVLKWARTNGCPWNSQTCSAAATNGHLEILKWAREHDCPWDTRTCRAAAATGHLELLKWARANGCVWSSRTIETAESAGHFHVAEWAKANGCPDRRRY